MLGSYTNPVINSDFPDPFVLNTNQGYYAYATQTTTAKGSINIQVSFSVDLVNWGHITDAMPNKPVWANSTQDFWAPHVVEDHGIYYLYFSALLNDRTGMAIGVATATQPTGPFIDSGKPLCSGNSFVNIDPMAFDDPVSEKKYLYWGSGFEPIHVRELAANRLEFASGSKAEAVVQPSKRKFENLIEAPFVVFRQGYYYLFYSGDNCWENHTYAVMVARATSPLGPFIKMSDTNGVRESILQSDSTAQWYAPGANSILRDLAGQDWIIYHAVDPKYRLDEVTQILRRPMLMDRIDYVDGWPVVLGGQASHSAQLAPHIDQVEKVNFESLIPEFVNLEY